MFVKIALASMIVITILTTVVCVVRKDSKPMRGLITKAYVHHHPIQILVLFGPKTLWRAWFGNKEFISYLNIDNK